jgi:hypothetical protein
MQEYKGNIPKNAECLRDYKVLKPVSSEDRIILFTAEGSLGAKSDYRLVPWLLVCVNYKAKKQQWYRYTGKNISKALAGCTELVNRGSLQLIGNFQNGVWKNQF